MDFDSNSKDDGYIVLCKNVHVARTLTRIPTPYFCIIQESESESVPVSESGNVISHYAKTLKTGTWFRFYGMLHII